MISKKRSTKKASSPKPSRQNQGSAEGKIAGPDVWESLRVKFEALAREEVTLQAEAHDCSLRAYGDYGPPEADLKEIIKTNDRLRRGAEAIKSLPPSERPEAWKQERRRWIQDGVLNAADAASVTFPEEYPGDPVLNYLMERRDPYAGPWPQFGGWEPSPGPDENFRARFEALGTAAGIALGTPSGTEPLEFWLHRLFLNLSEHGSPELVGTGKECGIIQHVCIASSTYCARLEKEAAVRETRAQQARRQQPKTKRGAATDSEKSAALVAKIIKELDTLKPQMFSEVEYEKLRKENPNLAVFKVANNRPDLRKKLKALDEYRRHIRLAQEFAAASLGKALSIIQSAWKTDKPKEYRVQSGSATVQKHGKDQMREWGKRGGRPRKDDSRHTEYLPKNLSNPTLTPK